MHLPPFHSVAPFMSPLPPPAIPPVPTPPVPVTFYRPVSPASAPPPHRGTELAALHYTKRPYSTSSGRTPPLPPDLPPVLLPPRVVIPNLRLGADIVSFP